jgi:hypothetical protein
MRQPLPLLCGHGFPWRTSCPSILIFNQPSQHAVQESQFRNEEDMSNPWER